MQQQTNIAFAKHAVSAEYSPLMKPGHEIFTDLHKHGFIHVFKEGYSGPIYGPYHITFFREDPSINLWVFITDLGIDLNRAAFLQTDPSHQDDISLLSPMFKIYGGSDPMAQTKYELFRI